MLQAINASDEAYCIFAKTLVIFSHMMITVAATFSLKWNRESTFYVTEVFGSLLFYLYSLEGVSFEQGAITPKLTKIVKYVPTAHLQK